MPPPADRMVWSKSVGAKRPSPFYVIWRGREVGVFYKWSDCKARVAGLADASFQGFATLEEAEYAFTSGPGAYFGTV